MTLFMINLYIMQTRSIVDMFNHSYGLYGDVWAAWAEGIINISVTVIVASKWGIIGILLGKMISLFIIVVIWKPYYLFSQGFKESISRYWKGIILYYVSFILAFALMISITIYLNMIPSPTTKSMLLYGIFVIIPSIIFYTLLLLIIGPGTKQLVMRIPLIKRIYTCWMN